jgi:hypothetical protein
MRRLRPWPRYSGAIRICSAQSTFGTGASSATLASTTASIPSVREGRDDSVPRGGYRVARAHDLVALVVPRIEEELRILGNDAPEEAIEDGIVVHDVGPNLRLGAGDMGLSACPFGTRRKMQRHVSAGLALPS